MQFAKVNVLRVKPRFLRKLCAKEMSNKQAFAKSFFRKFCAKSRHRKHTNYKSHPMASLKMF